MNSDRISRNPLNREDMTSFLLKMIQYRPESEALFDMEEAEGAKRLLSHFYKNHLDKWWNDVTEALICEDLPSAVKALGERYSKEQIIDMFQQVTQFLLSYFNVRECYDATRIMEEYENGGFGNEKNI